MAHETDTGNAKSDENTWMRLILDTVGKVQWPADPQGRLDLAPKATRNWRSWPAANSNRDIRGIDRFNEEAAHMREFGRWDYRRR